MKNWSENSQLCLNLLDPAYRKMYVKFAELPENTKRKAAMCSLANQASRIEQKLYWYIRNAEKRKE